MMMDPDYDAIVSRITDVYNSSSAAEQKMLQQILAELAKTGYSYTYEQIYLTDFSEIPVSIDRFLDDSYYLGGTNDNGKNIYPFWRDTMNDIFNNGNKYNEIILSGATRIGKSSTAVTMMAYMLYRLMLYRDPHKYFQKKAISKFTIGFANLTKELAFSVAYREFNDTLKEVPWFMDRGKVTRSDRNFFYLPEGDKIEIIAASDSAQLLGKQTWCVVGDTLIKTQYGPRPISSYVDKIARIYQYDGNRLRRVKAEIKLTRYADITVKLKLENGTCIEGTPDHKLMMSNERYKELKDISEGDYLFSTSLCSKLKVTHKLIQYHEMPEPVYDVIDVRPYHNFVIMVDDVEIISSNCVLIDEMNFAKSGVKDINIAKQHMKGLYDTVNARISGTFRIGGEVYGKLIAASSKNQDNDFLSDHIEKQQRAGNEHLYLVDEPQWKILPKSMFSDKVFHFTVGDRYKRGFVIDEALDDEEHRQEYERQGYRVVEAPAEFRKNFLADYDISLRDIAGISVAGAMGFMTQESITPCVSQDRMNPFYEDILVIGKDDDLEIADFFHLEAVPQDLKYQQLNIHLDLAESHNRTGIVGCCVAGNKVIETDEGKKVAVPFIKEVFAVAIEAPRGGKMSFQKVVNFIVWLRQNHFNVGSVTADKYQSSYLIQVLEQQGFDSKGLSPGMNEFIGLRNMIVDQRIELIKCPLQENELIATQRMNNKIYHPEDEGGGHGDIAESLAGSSSSLIAEQVSAHPPARNLAAIAASVNRGTARRVNPMSSSATISGPKKDTSQRPVHFPRLR